MTTFQKSCSSRFARMRGFTLIELMVAMAMLVVVGGATLTLFQWHAPYFNQQQNMASLNIAMQDAVTQMQLDLVNAGTGYYPGVNIPSWPIGVTIVNQLPSTNCFNSSDFTYTSTCFDTLNVLTMSASVPPAHPTDTTGSPTACSYTTNSSFDIQPITGMTVGQTAALFTTGTQVLLIKGGTGKQSLQSGGSQMGTFVLTGGGTANGNYVSLPLNASNADGTNSNANDPLSISTVASSVLGTSFCGTDWLMVISPTTYTVNATNSSDPVLVRTRGGVTDNIADQVIGFKVGAAFLGDTTANDVLEYHFNPADYGYNFSLIRSVRISIIGRTNPHPDAAYTFRNTFDQGPYQVMGSTVVMNPRNLSMNGN
jgi:prepilin-type N-terminal cleavage/methylation domain-containing protein